MRTRAAIVLALVPVAGVQAQPANDDCSAATPVAAFGQFAFDNQFATTDGLPNALCESGGTTQIEKDVWFCWTAPQSGPVFLTTCDLGVIFDTFIAVYAGCACPQGTGGIIACIDDACLLQPRVSWIAQRGQTYLIRVGVYPGSVGGPGMFSIAWGVMAGPLVSPVNSHSYLLLHPSGLDHAGAAADALGGELATIRSEPDNEWVRATLGNFGGEARELWIGLNDSQVEGQYVWSSGEPVVYLNWAPGEPNSLAGDEDFVAMYGTFGGWKDTVNRPEGTAVHGVIEVTPTACYPDCTGDGSLTVADFGCFQGKYVLGDLYADCNKSGNLTVADFGCFQGKYVLGCP